MNNTNSLAETLGELLKRLDNVGNQPRKEKRKGKGDDKTGIIAGMFAGMKRQLLQRLN